MIKPLLRNIFSSKNFAEETLADGDEVASDNDENPLSTLIVDDIVIPRADIVAFDKATTTEKIVHHFLSDGHSFYPIYEQTLDEIVGYVDSHAIVRTITEGRKTFTKDILKQPIFIVATTRLVDLLIEMRHKKFISLLLLMSMAA